MIAEDAGLDPFKLTYVKNGMSTVLFDGFSNYAAHTLLNTGYFQTADTVLPGAVLKVDQVFLFEFDQPLVGGYFKISETQNFGGQTWRLICWWDRARTKHVHIDDDGRNNIVRADTPPENEAS